MAQINLAPTGRGSLSTSNRRPKQSRVMDYLDRIPTTNPTKIRPPQPWVPDMPKAPAAPKGTTPTGLGALPPVSLSPPSLPNMSLPSTPGSGGLTFGGLARDVVQRIRSPFTYDPTKDPRYHALAQLAAMRGQEAGRRALEELNARGILNSTITAERLGQIQQAAERETLLQYIPEMYNQALQLRQQDINALANLAGLVQNQEQFGAGLRSDLYRFTRGLQADLWEASQNYSLRMAELAQRMREFNFDADMRRAAYELDRIALEQKLRGQTNPVVTSRVIGTVVGMESPDKAFRYVSENAPKLAADGADLGAVLDAIVARWPDHFATSSTSGMIPFGAFADEANPQ